jgi:hypothetical protein
MGTMSRFADWKLPRDSKWTFASCVLAVGFSVSAYGQYPGHIDTSKDAKTPDLRATAVFEYTGDLAKPTASRLIPVAVWDGKAFQPGGLYLAQPAPLAVETGTQYQLQLAGQSKGLFDVKEAERVSGSWIGVGVFQKETPPKVAKLRKSKNPPEVVQDYDPDKPHFAHRPADESKGGDTAGSGSKSSGSGSSTSRTAASNAPPVDPDRPTLHKRTDTTDSSSGSNDSTGNSTATDNTPAQSDPDRPTLHRKTDTSDSSASGSSSSSSTPDDKTAKTAPDVGPDRPTLHKHRTSSSSQSSASEIDPDRPHLQHGRPETLEAIDAPDSLQGLPADMEQIVAVSDVKTREPRSFIYSWANPDDAVKMQTALEDIAKKAVAPAASVEATTARKSTRTVANSRTAHRTTKPAPPPPLPDLADEQFKAYELSFGGGATLVFTARTAGEGDAIKYVTIIAQPDFYGTPQVMLKQVASANSLELTPRMRLVDAIDADADNRAELIFELRSKTDRQFAIYRVAGGQAEQVFNTGSTQ